jgi:hypothetical protein
MQAPIRPRLGLPCRGNRYPENTGFRMTSGEQVLMRLYFSYVEPIQIASKKRRRMAYFGVEDLDGLACGVIDLVPSAPDCGPVCAEIVEAHRRYLAKYDFEGDGVKVSSLWRAVPLVIELNRYRDFASYARDLKRRRKEVEKAREQGFYCKPFDRKLYPLELFDIDTSLRFRSGGPVLGAFLRRRPERATVTTVRAELESPSCALHWYTDFGVFAGASSVDRTEDRLVGYLFLKRVGNIVRVTALMGHGAYLARGVIKLLFADAIKWLLDREDPRVRGARYLHYGAIEHGGDGLIAWKRRFRFEPLRFIWEKYTGILVQVTAWASAVC